MSKKNVYSEKIVIMHPNVKFDNEKSPCFIDTNGKAWVPFNKCGIFKKEKTNKIRQMILLNMKISNVIVMSADVVSMQYTDFLLRKEITIAPRTIEEVVSNKLAKDNSKVEGLNTLEHSDNEELQKNGNDQQSEAAQFTDGNQPEAEINDETNNHLLINNNNGSNMIEQSLILKMLYENGEQVESMFNELNTTSRAITDIRAKIEEYRIKAESIYKQENDLMQDLLHYIELHDLDEKTKLRIIDEMKASRIRRRHADDAVQMATTIDQMLRTGGNTEFYRKFNNLIQFDTRNYHPRVIAIDEIFGTKNEN